MSSIGCHVSSAMAFFFVVPSWNIMTNTWEDRVRLHQKPPSYGRYLERSDQKVCMPWLKDKQDWYTLLNIFFDAPSLSCSCISSEDLLCMCSLKEIRKEVCIRWHHQDMHTHIHVFMATMGKFSLPPTRQRRRGSVNQHRMLWIQLRE